jgi:hypothetical protein
LHQSNRPIDRGLRRDLADSVSAVEVEELAVADDSDLLGQAGTVAGGDKPGREGDAGCPSWS